MAELVKLRTARKQLKRKADQKRAEENRATFGRSQADRLLQAARQEKARREFNSHRLEREDS
jgi:hypothetical protein